jgi:hypothetical protein
MDRYGLGTANNSRLLCHSSSMGKMSESARLALTEKDPLTAAKAAVVYGVAEALEETSKDLTQALLKGPSDAVKKSSAAFWSAATDLFDENVCENQQASFGKLLNNQMSKVIGLCEYFGNDSDKAFYRLGEALIYSTPAGMKTGWVYAGYVKEKKVPAGIKNYKGTKDRIRRGFKDRWKNFPDKKKGEVGPCGLRNIMRATTAMCSTLVYVLENEPNVNNRRLMLFAFLKKNIPAAGAYDEKTKVGKGWCEGIEFLCADMLQAPKLQQYMQKGQSAVLDKPAAVPEKPLATPPVRKPPARAFMPRFKAKPALIKKIEVPAEVPAEVPVATPAKTNETPRKSGAGGILALAAAAAGVYFLTKG